MKLSKLLFITPIIAVTTAIAPLAGCSNDRSQRVYDVKCVSSPINLLVTASDGTPTSYQRLQYEGTHIDVYADIYKFNNSEIPYIDVDDYVTYMMNMEYWYPGQKMVVYTSNTSNGITTITRPSNNPMLKATCKIDYAKQTITFDDYDGFLSTDLTVPAPLANGAGGGMNYFVDKTLNCKYTKGKEYTINLYEYNIPIYYHDGNGYIPFDLFRNLINNSDAFNLFYDGVQFWEVCNRNSYAWLRLLSPIKSEITILNKNYMEFTYDLLALTLDHRFGLKTRQSRAYPGKVIKYLPNGAYATLRKYHDRITSLDPDVSNDAIVELFAKELDDGGHAGYVGLNLLSTRPFKSGTNVGPEKQYTYNVQDKIVDARSSLGLDPVNVTGVNGASSYYKEYTYTQGTNTSKVAYITFDSFIADYDGNFTTAEKAAGRMLQSETNESNYLQDTMRLTMYANKMIQADRTGDKQIKALVVDLSNNGGGTVYTEHFIASWLCGGVTEKTYNPMTNAYCEYTVNADIDGDGKFDSNDILPEDIALYVITTPKSFSCGNMLPCNLKDCKKNVYFIGERCGGGACFVDSNMHIGLGNVFRSSSKNHLLRKTASYNNYITNDDGVDTDYHLDSINESTKFFDRDTINKKILNIE